MSRKITNELRTLAREAARGCIGLNVRRAARTLARIYDHELDQADLKGTQFSILNAVFLLRKPSMQQLAEALGMDRTTLTRNLRPLERDRLIVLNTGADRRMREIALTDAGQQLLVQALPLWHQAQTRVLDALGSERAEQLLGDLAVLDGKAAVAK